MNKSKRIKYFSYYGCNDPARKRDNSPAADSKIDYIISVLNRCGYAVDHISNAPSACNHYIPGYVVKSENNTLRYFASFGKGNLFFNKLNNMFMRVQFLFWCLLNIKKNEQVIVYHSLGYDATFIWLFRLKQVRIIGEIEEIYQDVHKQRKSLSINEYKFIDVCTKYIFPTSLMDEKLNKHKEKPSVVVHGIYNVESNVEPKFNDGKVHVVYGGTLDPKKGGAYATVAAANFLPNNFHVHICGFGDSTQILRKIADVKQISKAIVTFEGELKGDDYKHFIQKCHIGLSTQDPTAAFNATSFPSKILVYLSNGLRVVSIRIPVVEHSAIADCLCFYDEQSPKMIANAIMESVKADIDGKDILKKLDILFVKDLKGML